MKKILLLFFVLTVTMFAQTYDPYNTDGWDVPYAFTGEPLAKPSWSNSVGFYELGIFTIGTNPGGWLNRNFWRVDSLMESLVVYTDTNYIVIDNDTLTLAPYLLLAIDTNYSTKRLQLEPSDDIAVPWREGTLFYDTLSGAFVGYLKESGVKQQLGQEIYIPVYNGTASTITDGTPCYPTGATGEGIGTIEPGDADFDATSNIIGMATHTIEAGTYGILTRFGSIGDVVTTGMSPGATFYLKSGTGITDIEPDAPANSVPLGGITSVGANGSVFAIIERFNTKNGIASIHFADESEAIDATTNVQVTNATDDLFTYNTDVGHDITLSGDTIYVAEAGVYQFTMSASFGGGSGGLYVFTFKDNGSTIAGYKARRKTTNADVGSLAFAAVHKLDAGDYVTLWVEDTGTSSIITMVDCSISVIQVR